MRSRFHRFVEWILPWYDRDREEARNRETERKRQRAIAARIRAEVASTAFREDYVAMAQRLRR